MAVFRPFIRPVSGFRTIASEPVVGSIRKIDKIGPRKILRPVIYDSYIPIDVPRRSLRTNTQTNKQTNIHVSFINIEGLGLRPSIDTAAVISLSVLSLSSSFTNPCYSQGIETL